MKKILFASAECAPFVKTGGLGAVVGSLPKQLNHKKYDVRVVLPDYHCIDAKWREQMETLVTFPMYLGWRMQTVTVKTLKYEGIVTILLRIIFISAEILHIMICGWILKSSATFLRQC